MCYWGIRSSGISQRLYLRSAPGLHRTFAGGVRAPGHSWHRGIPIPGAAGMGSPARGGLLVQRLCWEGSPASAGAAPSITALPAARQRSEEVTLPNKQGGGWCTLGQEQRASRGASPVIYGLWELFADSAARWLSPRRGGCKDKHPPSVAAVTRAAPRLPTPFPGARPGTPSGCCWGWRSALPESQGCSGEGVGWLKAGTESNVLNETGPGSAGLPSFCHPGAASPGAGGMELALEQGSRQAGRGPGRALDPNTAGADLMK